MTSHMTRGHLTHTVFLLKYQKLRTGRRGDEARWVAVPGKAALWRGFAQKCFVTVVFL